MSFSNNFATHKRLRAWWPLHRLIARSPLTGKLVSSSEPAQQPAELPGANNGASAASTLPAAAAPSVAGQFLSHEAAKEAKVVFPSSPSSASRESTRANLGLRYSR